MPDQTPTTPTTPDAPDALRMVQEGAAPSTISSYGRTRKLFFVSGHPRSGTTWLGAVLMRHPRVFCDGEFNFQLLRNGFDSFQSVPSHRATREPVHTAAELCFQDTVRICLGACANTKPDAEWVGDRTPRRLLVMLPGASHIVIVRDGRDVTVSAAFMYLHGGFGAYTDCENEPELVRTRERFLTDAEHFKKQPEALLACEPFVRAIAKRWAWQVAHDRRVAEQIRAGELDARVHEVRYERLHAEPEAERERMYTFLGLDPSEALPLTAESRTLPGLKQDDHHSDKRKGEVGDWQHYFTPQARRWFTAQAGQELIAHGYAHSDSW